MFSAFALALCALYVRLSLTDTDIELAPPLPLPNPCYVYASPNGMFVNILVLVCIRKLLLSPHLVFKIISNTLYLVLFIVTIGIDTGNAIYGHVYHTKTGHDDARDASIPTETLSDEDTVTVSTHYPEADDEAEPGLNSVDAASVYRFHAETELLLSQIIADSVEAPLTTPTVDANSDVSLPHTVNEAAASEDHILSEPIVQVLLTDSDDNASIASAVPEEDATPAPVITEAFFALTVDADGNCLLQGLPQNYAASSSGSAAAPGVRSPPYPIVWPEEEDEFKPWWVSRRSLFRSWDDEVIVSWLNEVARELNHRRHQRNLQFSPITVAQRKWVLEVLMTAYEDSKKYALDHINMATESTDQDKEDRLIAQHMKSYPVDASTYAEDF
ncbi:hypothetical protein LPJ73_001320 [Coemansia sp. RSA 2703]|nr:hypothetical protein LPJ73_001320 [Coemansia sp. RSA 2703]